MNLFTGPIERTFRLIIGAACIVLFALGLEVRAWCRPPTLHVFDVGQGDGILVSSGGVQIVIDGGPDGAMLSALGRTMPFFDRTIDLLVLSHPHLDHVQSFPELLRRYRIRAVLLTGVDYDNPRYEEFLTLLAEERATILVADPTKDIIIGNLLVDVLWPPPLFFGRRMKDVNNNSTALRVSAAGGASVLLTGDMEGEQEEAMLRMGIDLHTDILKVAHHGSRTSSSTGFLLATKATLGIVSVAANNAYGLPDEDVLARFAVFGIPLRLTSVEGTIDLPLEKHLGTQHPQVQ